MVSRTRAYSSFHSNCCSFEPISRMTCIRLQVAHFSFALTPMHSTIRFPLLQRCRAHATQHRKRNLNEKQRITNQIGHPLILIRYRIKRVEIQMQERRPWAWCAVRFLYLHNNHTYSCCCCCRHEAVCVCVPKSNVDNDDDNDDSSSSDGGGGSNSVWWRFVATVTAAPAAQVNRKQHPDAAIEITMQKKNEILLFDRISKSFQFEWRKMSFSAARCQFASIVRGTSSLCYIIFQRHDFNSLGNLMIIIIHSSDETKWRSTPPPLLP